MIAELSTSLSPNERDEYKECEATLDANEDGFIAYIRALKSIRDKTLYREDFATFDAYLVSRRKKYTRQRVSQLIQHVEVLDALSCQPMVDSLPENERQTRPLLALSDPVEQAAAWLGAQQAAGQDQPSGGWVQSGVDVVNQVKQTEGLVDANGHGQMVGFTSAIISEEAARRNRQRDHINANTKREPPLAVIELPAAALAGIAQLAEQLSNVDDAEMLRLVIYKVQP